MERYEIDRELGEGAYGRVFLVRDEHGQRLALKLFHPTTEGADLSRIRQELEAGSRVDHANVVRTFEAGAIGSGEAQTPYLVMEYVEGQTLRELLSELGRLSEAFCLHVAAGVAHALHALHRADVVHRDLRPENVILTHSEQIKVADLGAALISSIARRDRKQTTGSLLYSAPEALRDGGRGVDGRADLYSLGLMLYELATGAYPFAARDALRVVQAHFHTVPRPLRELRPELSRTFSDLVASLLKKNPDHRLPSAEALLARLEDGPTPSSATAFPAGSVEETPPFVGRETELERLLEFVRRAFQGRGSALLVEGRAGLGKTRLIHELYGRVKTMQRCYRLRGAATANGGPFTPFVDALREALRGASLPRTPGEAGRKIQAFAEFALGAAPSGTEPELDLCAAQFALTEILRALARDRPVLLTIDDLHLAPPESRRMFEALATELRHRPVALVGTVSPQAVEDGDLRAERIRLDRLDTESTEVLLSHLLSSEEAAAHLLQHVESVAAGNPLAVVETLRELREQEAVQRTVAGPWRVADRIRSTSLPASLRALHEARLARMALQDRKLLEICACAGESDLGDLQTLMAESSSVLTDRIDRLTRAWLALGETGRYSFVHEHARLVVLDQALPRHLQEHHDALAARTDAGTDPAGAGLHLLRGSRPHRARPLLERAWSRLAEEREYGRAAELCRAALSRKGVLPNEARLEWSLRLCRALTQLGDLEDVLASASEALECALEQGDKEGVAEARCLIGSCLRMRGDYDDALVVAREAVQAARESGSPRLECETLDRLALVEVYVGRFDDAERHLAAARVLASQRADPALRARVQATLAYSQWERGSLRDARISLLNSADLARRSGLDAIEIWGTTAAAECSNELNELAEGRHLAQRALRHARERGRRDLECPALRALGDGFAREGRFAEALGLIRRSLGVARQYSNECEEFCGRYQLCRVLVGEGRWGRALASLRELREHARTKSRAPCVQLAQVLLTEVLGRVGRLEEAAACGETGLAQARGLGHRLRECGFLAALGDVHCFSGDLSAGRERFAAARRILKELAIEDVEIRIRLIDAEVRLGRRRIAGDLLAPLSDSDALEARVFGPLFAALLGLGSVEEGCRALDEWGPRLPAMLRLRASALAWRAGADGNYLTRAFHTLQDLKNHAPFEDRGRMATNVAEYREIEAAVARRAPREL